MFPICIGVDATFCLDKKTVFVKIRLFGIKILSVILYFAPKGIEYSFNGRVEKKAALSDKKKNKIPFGLTCIRITALRVTVYGGAEVTSTSLFTSFLSALCDVMIRYLRQEKVLDRAEVRVLPCYVNEQGTAIISIRLFSGIALFLSGIIHTKSRYAKRSNRQDNG